jgi:hypothetical protein
MQAKTECGPVMTAFQIDHAAPVGEEGVDASESALSSKY